MDDLAAVDRHHNGPTDAERIELADVPAPKGRGRPSLYTPETVDRICDRLADGESLKAICRVPGMPSERAVLGWAASRPEFRGQYDFAREVGRETISHDVLAIADGLFRSPDEIKDARRNSDALKWRFGRMTPKRRGNLAAGELIGPTRARACASNMRCKSPAIKTARGAWRCPLHGGLSTGPKTPEGKARIRAAARARWEAYRAEKGVIASNDGTTDPAQLSQQSQVSQGSGNSRAGPTT